MSGSRVDVLVAGGGPVGLATAIGCKLAGLSVLVAEPRPGPVDKACGEGVMPAAVRRLAALGVTPDGYPLRGIRYREAHRAGSGCDRQMASCPGGEFSGGGSPGGEFSGRGYPGDAGAEAVFRHGHGLGVRRTVLHAALAERAAELGIPVLPVRVTGFEQYPGHVCAAGIEARYLVAADGLHSAIRRALGTAAVAGSGAAVASGGGVASGVAVASGGAARSGGATASRVRAHPARYGLRRHYYAATWTDMVEVHWAERSEAYVTPVSADMVGVALLFAGPGREAREGQDGPGRASGRGGGSFDDRLASDFPELRARLGDAAPASAVRGAGPLRHDVRRRVHGRVLLVGDASGYLDALTGEGIGVGVAQAEALAGCLAAGRPGDYEQAWRRVSGPAWRLTAGLLWSRGQPLLAPRIVPAARRLPWLFSALVNHAAQALARQYNSAVRGEGGRMARADGRVPAWLGINPRRPVVLSVPHPQAECLRLLGQVTTVSAPNTWYLDGRTLERPDPLFRGQVHPSRVMLRRFKPRSRSSYGVLDAQFRSAAGQGTELAGWIGPAPGSALGVFLTVVFGLIGLALLVIGVVQLARGNIVGVWPTLAFPLPAAAVAVTNGEGRRALHRDTAELLSLVNQVLGSTATFPGHPQTSAAKSPAAE